MYRSEIYKAKPKGKESVWLKNSSKVGERATKKPVFLSPHTTFILTRLGEKGIYIWGCVLWFLHNYRVAVLRLGGVLEVYGGGHEGTSPPVPRTIWCIDVFKCQKLIQACELLIKNCPKICWINCKVSSKLLKVWTEFFQAEPNLCSPKPLHRNEAQFQCLEGGQ